jgi:hypothetical protein
VQVWTSFLIWVLNFALDVFSSTENRWSVNLTKQVRIQGLLTSPEQFYIFKCQVSSACLSHFWRQWEGDWMIPLSHSPYH